MSIYLKDIFRELDEFGPDIIQISTPDLIALKFLKYGKEKKIPVISIYHTDFPSYLTYYKLDIFQGTVWREMVRFYNKCDMVFTPTREMKKQLEEKGAKNVSLWSRGIRTDKFDHRKRSDELRDRWRARGRKVILFSGRFVKYKDLDMVVEVYKRFKKDRRKDVLFVLLGSGPMEGDLKESMEGAVFPGYLHDEALFRAYASGDIFLFPSTTETFGNVVLEAMSSGLPCIVSDVGGCQEIIEESNGGLICRAKDVDSFYQACLRLINDTDLYNSFRERCIRWTQNRTWESINNALLDEFIRLIKEKKST
jgi:glycosyltransferase involved in cell wall biosynthesis